MNQKTKILENENINELIALPEDKQKDELIPKQIKNMKGVKNIGKERSKSHENNSKTKKSLLKKK